MSSQDQDAIQSQESAIDLETQPLLAQKPAEDIASKLRGDIERVAFVFAWIMASSAVVLYNKWLFASGGFPYPWTLTCMHMTSCFVVFGAIRKLAPEHIRLAIMPDANVEVTWNAYFKNFVSISLFYAATLGTGQMAYLLSSVPFVQMMKPMNCITASIAAFIVGMETPTNSHLVIVVIIASGVVVASHNAAQFSTAGCLFQIASSVTEGFRLSLVQCALTSGLKLDPVSTVYNFSFPSAILLAFAAYFIEWPLNLSKLVSPWALLLNCTLAVVLNVLVANVIKKTSAVIFTLSGVFKDMLVIGSSSLMFATPVTKMMACGYSTSLVGLMLYKTYKDNFELFKQRGFLGGMSDVMTMAAKRPVPK